MFGILILFIVDTYTRRIKMSYETFGNLVILAKFDFESKSSNQKRRSNLPKNFSLKTINLKHVFDIDFDHKYGFFPNQMKFGNFGGKNLFLEISAYFDPSWTINKNFPI
jgi:hypothetical protein